MGKMGDVDRDEGQAKVAKFAPQRSFQGQLRPKVAKLPVSRLFSMSISLDFKECSIYMSFSSLQRSLFPP